MNDAIEVPQTAINSSQAWRRGVDPLDDVWPAPLPGEAFSSTTCLRDAQSELMSTSKSPFTAPSWSSRSGLSAVSLSDPLGPRVADDERGEVVVYARLRW